MIIDDFLVQTDRGLFCKYGNFYLDPHKPVETAVISHAHGDHAIKGNKTVYCTEATRLIMQLRFKKSAAHEFYECGYHLTFKINSVQLSFYPAGHILGSAMILMEYQNMRYLYTGDYKLQHDETCEKAEFVEADVFITESTFANPNTQHPNAEEEIKKLNTVKSNIMLGAYVLGKSQRLIKLINNYCPEKIILVHQNILSTNAIYERLGINLGKYQAYNRKLMKQNLEGYIYLVPPLTFNNYSKAVNVVRAFASGWTRLQQQNGLSLYISDHVDWNDILISIQQVKPQEIWTLHGDGNHLKEYFKDKITVKIL